MNTPSVIPTENLLLNSRCSGRGLRHPLLRLRIHPDLVVNRLLDPDLLHHGAKQDVGKKRANDQRQPPALCCPA